MIPDNYLEKVYSGFLGKCVGIRLGAPVEPALWTMDRIEKTYGYIDQYVKPYKNFAADDDSNGPAYFIRALIDDARGRKPEPQDVAKAWLNYAREGVGMFWWGGYGISTEHTAYINLKKGIEAPRSGSIKQNGEIIAEQIGGQIFIDTFGLVNPCEPERAAEYGAIAASVSHDGEGLNGARFFCAAIAEAFRNSDITQVIEVGLSTIPQDSEYYRVARAVQAFHQEYPDDFRACMRMLDRDWSMKKYLGNCHIIPNAGVCFLALYYGEGDFCKTIEIACTCGMDTDCNAGNVATILGIVCGLDGIPEKYRKPINDGIVLSGISGYLNILDLPTFAKEICILGYEVAGEKVPQELIDSYRPGKLYFDFELPGSTHDFRASDECLCQIRHSAEICKDSQGALEILYSQFYRGQTCKIYYKTFYTRDDFSDERYMPAFSPKAVSGQTVRFDLYNEQWTGLSVLGINPYVHTINGNYHIVQYSTPETGNWNSIEFMIPDTNGEIIDEVGFEIEGLTKKADRCRGRLFVDNFEVFGKGVYSVDFAKQRVDFGSLTPLVHSDVSWRRVGDIVQHVRHQESFSYTGNYYARYQKVSLAVTPRSGTQHMLTVRSQGIMRGYFSGFDENDTVAIYKKDFVITKLASAPFIWRAGVEYRMELVADGDLIQLRIDGDIVLEIRDDSFNYGMVGFGSMSMGRTDFTDLRIESDI